MTQFRGCVTNGVSKGDVKEAIKKQLERFQTERWWKKAANDANDRIDTTNGD